MNRPITDNGLLSKATGVRTFHLLVSVTGYMEGELEDWPNNIKDRIHAALEAKADEVGLPLTVVFSKCDKDAFSPENDPKFYVYVIASEIVAADSRMFKDEKAKIKAIIADVIAGRKTLN